MAFWEIFQRSYDRIDKWEWSDEMKVAIQKINDNIPKVIRKAIKEYLADQYKVSENHAKRGLKRLKEQIGNLI